MDTRAQNVLANVRYKDYVLRAASMHNILDYERS